ncbi:MAG: diguanylate cyclase domain-containing protein [Phycisphaerae bacterium]
MTEPHESSSPSLRRPILRNFLAIYVVVGLFFAGALALFYRVEYTNRLESVRLHETFSLRVQEEVIGARFEGILSDVRFLIHLNEMYQLLRDGQEGKLGELGREYRRFLEEKRLYDKIRLYDTKPDELLRVEYRGGKPRLFTGRAEGGECRECVEQTLSLPPGTIYVSSLDLEDDGERRAPYTPVIRFSISVPDAAGQPLGAIVLSYRGNELFKLLQNAGATGSGRLMLVNLDGYWLRSPDPGKQWGYLLPGREKYVFQADYPDVWDMVRNRESGQVYGDDGLFTYVTVYPLRPARAIAGLNTYAAENAQSGRYCWKLISFVPTERLQARTGDFRENLVLLFGVMMILSSLPAWSIASVWIKHRRAQSELKHRADYDVLTGLPNRSLLHDRLEQMQLEAERYRFSYTVLFIDLDGFKSVNDTLGHDAGDELLVTVAQRIRKCVRKSDTVARLGGDEFTVILARTESIRDGIVVARKVIDQLDLPFKLAAGTAEIGASVGIAMYPQHARTIDELLAEADEAMYQAKQAGKGRYQLAGQERSASTALS